MCFVSLKYLNKGFSRGETSFLQVTLVSLAAGSSYPMDEACHLYSSFSQELKKYIMDIILPPDALCDKSLPQLS